MKPIDESLKTTAQIVVEEQTTENKKYVVTMVKYVKAKNAGQARAKAIYGISSTDRDTTTVEEENG